MTRCQVFGQQADVTVIYPFERVKDHHTNRLQGEYSVTHAVAILLDNTGLQAQFSPEGHLVITQVDETKGKRMNTNKRKTVLATMVGLFAAGGMTTTMAQEQVGESARAQSVLDEIIVTAQKREQNVQDVAIAITAISGDQLKAKGIDSPSDLQFSVPGLTLGATITGGAQVTMRGIGAENLTPGGDPGVPLHIDGHYIQSSAYMLKDFFDVERVEVLRGPQGTLYGRNAVGGSINIISKKPTDEFEGEFGVDVGNYSKRLVRAVVSGPLTEKLRGRLVVSDEKRDGFIENISTLGLGEAEFEDSDYTVVRGALEYDISDNIEVLISGYYFDDSGKTVSGRISAEYPFGSTIIPGFTHNYYEVNSAGPNITAIDPRKVKSNFMLDQSNVAKGASIDIDWDLGNVLVKSLSAYNKDTKIGGSDQDTSDVVTQHEVDTNSYETFSQEFQLLSNQDSALNWILGLFYYDENATGLIESEFDNFFVVGGPVSTFFIPSELDSKSQGIFGQLDYSITDSLELTVGLRYNKDKKTYLSAILIPDFGLVAPDGSPLVNADNNQEWTKTTGKLGLNYHFNDSGMLYLSYSTGYKAGGFNLGQDTPYDPEEIEAIEGGIKADWLDRRLQTNLSIFHYDYTDKQEFKRDAIGFINLINAGAATVWGAEFELNAAPVDGLGVDFSVAYLNTEYDEFSTFEAIDPAAGEQDLAGNNLPRSPELKLHLGIQYAWNLNDSGALTARIDTSWVDKQYSNHFNRLRDEMESYSRTNANITWDSLDELWQAEFYVQNLEDDDVISNLFETGGFFGASEIAQFHPPRTYGLRVTRHF